MEGTTTTEGFSMKIDNAAIADVIERAADLYESERINWCQGGFFNSNNDDYPLIKDSIVSACAWGAIILASAEGNEQLALRLTFDGELQQTDPTWELATAAKKRLAAHVGVAEVPGFNDERGRTKQEIIDAMKDTAKELRNHV
jgi:hypothetical protein